MHALWYYAQVCDVSNNEQVTLKLSKPVCFLIQQQQVHKYHTNHFHAVICLFILAEIFTSNILIKSIWFFIQPNYKLIIFKLRLCCANSLLPFQKPKYFLYWMFTNFLHHSTSQCVCSFFTFFSLFFLSCFLQAADMSLLGQILCCQ